VTNGGALLFLYNCTVPVGSTAALALPAVANAAAVVVREGVAAVFQDNAFVPGVAGVAAAAASDDGASVLIELGSGSYSFSVSAASE